MELKVIGIKAGEKKVEVTYSCKEKKGKLVEVSSVYDRRGRVYNFSPVWAADGDTITVSIPARNWGIYTD